MSFLMPLGILIIITPNSLSDKVLASISPSSSGEFSCSLIWGLSLGFPPSAASLCVFLGYRKTHRSGRFRRRPESRPARDWPWVASVESRRATHSAWPPVAGLGLCGRNQAAGQGRPLPAPAPGKVRGNLRAPGRPPPPPASGGPISESPAAALIGRRAQAPHTGLVPPGEGCSAEGDAPAVWGPRGLTPRHPPQSHHSQTLLRQLQSTLPPPASAQCKWLQIAFCVLAL